MDECFFFVRDNGDDEYDYDMSGVLFLSVV